jgi:DNA-binding transcriptional ArsR family regulator
MAIEEKLDVIIRRLGVIEERITKLEEGEIKKPKKRAIAVPLGDKYQLNPWVIATMYGTGIDRLGNISFDALDSLKPTIKALVNAYSQKNKMLTAAQVKKVTKRERNTESGHLNRLHRMGLVEKRKQGKETLYRLTAEGKSIIGRLYPTLS